MLYYARITSTEHLKQQNRKRIFLKMKFFYVIASVLAAVSVQAAYQYNTKGNQGWMTFDSATTVSFELDRSGKDKDHENFIDRGQNVTDYGWYNMDTGETGSFNNGVSATFTENDRIGLYVTDATGKTFWSTKPGNNESDDVVWGKSRVVDGALTIYGGNMGSNGTHEYYVFKISANKASGNAPSGQPLPGILAVLAVGGAGIGLKKIYDRKKKGESK